MHGRLRAEPRAVVARRRPAGLQRQAPRPRLAAVRGDHGRSDQARPGDRRRRGEPDDQRAGGVHAGQRVHPRRVGGSRVLRGRGILCPRDCRCRRDRAADGPLDRRRRAGARSLEDGHPPVRRPVPEPGVHARPDDRGLRDLLRHPLPERGAPGGPAAAPVAGLRAARGARCGLRREVRLGATELVRPQRGPRARGTSPAWLGRRALVDRDRRRGARHARDRRAVRRELVCQDRGRRGGCLRVPPAALRE